MSRYWLCTLSALSLAKKATLDNRVSWRGCRGRSRGQNMSLGARIELALHTFALSHSIGFETARDTFKLLELLRANRTARALCML